MNICIVSIISPGSLEGVGTFNNHFLKLFSSYKHQVIFLFVDSNNTGEDLTEVINEYCIQITLRKPFLKYYNNLKGYFRPNGSNAPKWIAAGFAIRDWLLHNHKKFAIDIIEVSDGGGIGIFLMDNNLPPVILTGHGSNLQISRYDYTCYDEHGKVIKALERLSYQHTEAIISHSEFNFYDLKTFTKKPVYTLPNPWTDSVKNSNETIQGTYGLAVGKLRYFKGPHLLCAALSKINLKEAIVIKWIGDDTETIKGYSSFSAYLQQKFDGIFQKKFQWQTAKPHAQIIEEIKRALYIIIPSVWETFSYVALEAASLGKPIIITKTTGASYLFTNNENALIIDSNNEEALSSAILHLHNNKNLRDYLGRNAMQMVAEKFKPEAIVNKRIEVYEKIIQNRKSYDISFEENIAFLKKYLTNRRRIYFFIRAKLKTIYRKLK